MMLSRVFPQRLVGRGPGLDIETSQNEANILGVSALEKEQDNSASCPFIF